MSGFDPDIDDFAKENGITGQPREIPNLIPTNRGARCYETIVSRGSASVTLYTYAGEGWTSLDLSGALHDAMEIAEDLHGWPTYDLWNKDHEGFYEEEFSKEFAWRYYLECKSCADALRLLLGEDLYNELANLYHEHP